MQTSKLATLSVDFGNKKSNPRKYKVSKITPHHMAGIMAADDCARSHLYSNRESSANYYIGNDGLICSGPGEDRRCWTSASRENDHAAITIEISNSGKGPDWPISAAAYNSLVNLCADICQRYGITPHFNGDPSGSITIHKMFQKTDCPGPYLERIIRSGQLERDIRERMQAPAPEPDPGEPIIYRVQTGAFKEPRYALAIGAQMNDAGFDTYMVKVGGMIKVQAGAFKSKKYANELLQQLSEAGFEAFITTEAGVPYKPGTGKRSAEEIAREVWMGKWGNDPERAQKLRAAGYDPAEIQAAIKKLYYS